MRAPICPRPVEKAAIDVSALVSELQLILPHQGIQALIPRLRPALATKVFKRAYGKRGQVEHGKYITELANLQSQRVLKLATGSAELTLPC
jgi:hypothetical protein